MPRVEVEIPDRLATEIDQLAEDEEFLGRDDAIEELLTRGVSAYEVEESTERSEEQEELFDQTAQQRDPAALEEESDEPTF